MGKKSRKLHQLFKEPTGQLGWWIEIFTANPICIYYFGVFENPWEAALMNKGYIQDLQAEGAVVISDQIKHCQPKQLTIFAQELHASDFKIFPSVISF